MASSDRLTRLRNIRDNFEKELSDETDRRVAFTAAGKPPPVTYSVSGRSMSWTEYVRTMQEIIKNLSEQLTAMGADTGGIPEASIQLY